MFVLDFIRITKRSKAIKGRKSPGLSNQILAKEYFHLKLKELQKKYTKQEFYSYRSNFGFTLAFLKFETMVYLFNEIFIENQYYFASKTESPLIIDCGSNIGMSILYFKLLYPKSQILGFEPFEPAYKILKENIERNSLDDVSIFQLALSDREGSLNIFYAPEKPGSLSMSTVSERGQGQPLSIQSTLLSKYIDSNVDFLKMDIEGAELSVIQELDRSKKLHFVQEMFIEYHHHIKQDVDALSLVLAILEDNNFGYQLASSSNPPFQVKGYQDVLIYAYRK